MRSSLLYWVFGIFIALFIHANATNVDVSVNTSVSSRSSPPSYISSLRDTIKMVIKEKKRLYYKLEQCEKDESDDDDDDDDDDHDDEDKYKRNNNKPKIS